MSKTLRYDALLVRSLALELARKLGGARIHSARFDTAGRRIRIATGRGTLFWDLHPHSSGLAIDPPRREAGNVAVRPGSVLRSVRALPDERILEIGIDADDAGPGQSGVARLLLELFGAHSNAIAIDASGNVLASLRRGPRGRPVLRGAPYSPPAPSGRAGIDAPIEVDAFRSILAGVDGAGRAAALLERVAWTSPLNVQPILAPVSAEVGEIAITEAYRRYVDACHGPVEPVLLMRDGVAQPYPRPLPNVEFERVPDLMAAFGRAGGGPGRAAGRDAALATVEARIAATRRRLDRLGAEADGAAADAATLRRNADLLLAQAGSAGRGKSEVVLDDWAGGTIRIELDPALDAAANAGRFYGEARRRERAARRIPELLRSAAREIVRLEDLAGRIRLGGDDAPSPAALTEWGAAGLREPARGKPAESLPYRRYRSRSGLEIRVGRGARANDELTLRHARPDDIFLHARDVAGAHVILVWGRRDQNPPESDLVDAAVLAALHSRARTSATVPVDWTRRKYVRKPRRASPGAVSMERGRTLFVTPDPALAARLRTPGLQP